MKHFPSSVAALTLAACSLSAQSTPPSAEPKADVTVYGKTAESAPEELPKPDAGVITGQTLQERGLLNTRDLSGAFPNLAVFDANNDRSPKFSVRGLRENNFGTGDPAVGMYVDGVPYSDITSRGLALFDVEEIDFLRDSQGSRFGANGPGGVLNIRTRQPGDVATGHAGIGYGNYNSLNGSAGISGPIVAGKLSLGLSGVYSRRDGFVKNLTTGERIDSKETVAGRIQLRWTPSEQFELGLTVHGQKFNDGFVPTYDPVSGDKGPFEVKRDYNGYVNTDAWGVSLKGAYHNEAVAVTSVTSYRDWRQNLRQDFDFFPFPARIGFSQPEIGQWSEEVHVESADKEQPLKWLAGVYVSAANTENESGSVEMTPIPLLPPPPNTFRTLSSGTANTYALFGEATYTLWEKLDLTGGARLTYDNRSLVRDRRLESSVFPGFSLAAFQTDDSFTDISPKFGVGYKVTDHIKVYGQATRAYQSGGFNTSNDTPLGARYGSMHAWQFEAGVKTDWLDERLYAGANVFYHDYDEYQVYRLNPLDPSQAFIVNADSVISYGAEFNVAARPVENLDLGASVGLTEAQFESFGAASGNEVNMVPEYTGLFSAQYHFPWHLMARVEWQAFGGYFLDEGNSLRQGAFGLLNARVGYEHKNFSAYVFGRNLLDKEYSNNALDLRNAFQPAAVVFQPGDPATFGFALEAKF